MIRRLAHRIWEIFEKEGIRNDADGNYRCAEGIIRRILNGTYKIDEFRKFLNDEDYEYLKKQRDDIARLEKDSDGD